MMIVDTIRVFGVSVMENKNKTGFRCGRWKNHGSEETEETDHQHNQDHHSR